MKPVAKTADAFRTIAEVSDELSVPKHVLRFWELKFAQIKPMKRGGGRRYYRPQDLDLLRGIHHLLHNAGYTIRGVQKILREQGLDAVKHPAAPPMADHAIALPVAAPRVGGLASPGPFDRRAAIQSVLAELDACLSIARTGTTRPAVMATASLPAQPARRKVAGERR